MSHSRTRQYEAIFIYRPGEESFNSGKSQVVEEFKNAGIKILGENDMGEKTLAYQIKKNDRGHYICYNVEANPDSLKPIEKSLKLKSEILKYVFFRKDK